MTPPKPQRARKRTSDRPRPSNASEASPAPTHGPDPSDAPTATDGGKNGYSESAGQPPDTTERPVIGKTRPFFALGIDAGTNSGFAAWDRRRQEFRELKTLTFWSLYDHVIDHYPPGTAVIVIEDPNMNAPVFSHGEDNRRKREKIAQNVGSVKRESSLLIERFRYLGYDVRAVKPNRRKWSEQEWMMYTGHRGRISQHCRDAGRLVIGM